MDPKIKYYGKIIFSQLTAFMISGYLIKNVFIGSEPIVQVQFQQEVKQFPAKTAVFIKNIPKIITDQSSQMITDIFSGISFKIPNPPYKNPYPTKGSDTGNKPTIIETPTNLPQITLGIQPEITAAPTQISIPTGIYFPPKPDPTSFFNPQNFPTRVILSTQIPTVKPTMIPTRPTDKPSQGQPGGNSALEQQTVNIINQKRQSKGLRQLLIDINLTQAARYQSQDNYNNGQCDHYSKNGFDPWDRANDTNYRGSIYGEAVACGMSTPQQAIDWWWASPPHHAVLTSNQITKIGLGWINNYQTAVVGY